MNKAQGAGATAEAEEVITDTGEETAQRAVATEEESQESARLRTVLANMDLPEGVADQQFSEAEKGKGKGKEQVQEKVQQQEEEETAHRAVATEEAAEKPTEEAEQEQEHEQEEWPQSAKARVAEEANKRRKATERATKAETMAQELAARLEQAQRNGAKAALPPATPDDPFSDVFDERGLNQAVAEWEAVEEFANKNPKGADDVLVGKDAQGNEIRKSYTEEDIADMKISSAHALRRVEAKRAWISDAAKNNAQAREDYPEMFEAGTDENKLAAGIFHTFPQVLRRSDAALLVGDVIAGMKLRAAKAKAKGKTGTNGERPLSEAARKIVEAPKFKAAPSVSGGRSLERGDRSDSRKVDVKHAEDKAIESGLSEDAMVDLVTTLRNKTADRDTARRAVAT